MVKRPTLILINIQKLLFLIDRKASQYVDGPHFTFQAYYYGPFDAAIYEILDQLVTAHKVIIDRSGPYRTYALSEAGREHGLDVLTQHSRTANISSTRISRWVLSSRSGALPWQSTGNIQRWR